MIPRLPGHGTSGADLIRTGGRDWFRRAEDSYRDLSLHCPEIVVIGVSMGALLALHLGALFSPAGIVAAAPALVLKNRTAFLAPLLKYLVRELPVQNDDEYEDPDREYINREYWSVRRLASVAELLKVRRRVKRELRRVSAPLLLLETLKDELVSLKSGEGVSKMVSSQRKDSIVLEESEHQLLDGKERDKAAQGILTWLNELTGN